MTSSSATKQESSEQGYRARRHTGVRLSLAIAESGQSVKGLARCSGLSEAKLRAIKDGRHGMTLDVLGALPACVRDPILTEFAERLGLDLFRSVVTRGGF